MVEIPLIHKSGRSSNSFFDGVRARVLQLNGYTLSLIGLGLLVLLVAALLLWRQSQLWYGVTESGRQLQTINALVQQTHAARAQVDHFLITGQSEDYTATTDALSALSQAIDSAASPPDDTVYYDFQNFATVAQTTLNTVRSLETLGQAGNLSQNALPQLRLSAQQSAKQLAAYANDLSVQANVVFHEAINRANRENQQLQLALIAATLVIILISIAGYVHLTHTTNSGLDAITQAVHAIAEGNYNQQSTVTRTDKIGRLTVAFNDMAANLQSALQTESAANEQNRRQIMKLAQQERMTAILEERQRIARELHDSVKQQLFSITLATGAAINLLDHDVDLARTYLTHVQQTGSSAQSEMTTLLQEMTPAPLHDQHLEDALFQYLAPLCELHNLKLIWRVEGTNTLTIAQEHALFRITQEAAANVIRHSRAIVLRISLRFGLQTSLVIEDDGQGFDPEAIPRTSTGLATMRLRIKQVGGRLTLNSIIGQGTKLEIILDLRRKL